jgi:hypothetical protein
MVENIHHLNRIWPSIKYSLLGFSQFRRRNQFHGFGDLLRIFYASDAPFYIF